MFAEIAFYLLAYHIDMFSAIVFFKIKPNLFSRAETNTQLKALLNNNSVTKTYFKYTFIIALQYLILVYIGVLLTMKITTGDWTLISSINFTVVFMTIIHVLGFITNLGSMIKKEIVIEKK